MSAHWSAVDYWWSASRLADPPGEGFWGAASVERHCQSDAVGDDGHGEVEPGVVVDEGAVQVAEQQAADCPDKSGQQHERALGDVVVRRRRLGSGDRCDGRVTSRGPRQGRRDGRSERSSTAVMTMPAIALLRWTAGATVSSGGGVAGDP